MSEDTKATIEILEGYHQKGGFYNDIPVEIMNVVENELEEKDTKIEKLKQENNDLRKLYKKTYKHLFEKGNDELASYFQAQIDDCPTFYVEPIIDYSEEYKRLNNIINELEKDMKEKYHSEIDYQSKIMRSDLMQGDYPVSYYYSEQNEKLLNYYLNKIKELKEKNK